MARPVYERLWLEFSGCYIPVVTYFAVKKVKTCMRWSTIEVDALCTVPVTRTLLPAKYVKGLRKDRTRTFSSLRCITCSTAVNHVTLRVWVVFLQPLVAGQILAIATLKHWKVPFSQGISTKPLPAKLDDCCSAPQCCQEEANPIRCGVMNKVT